MILLTDEENPYPYNPEPTFNLPNTGHDAFKAGAKAQLKKVVEWGNEECKKIEHISSALHSNPKMKKKHRCPDCWQALLEETK